MIPFFEQPVLRVGSLSFHAFGLLVGVAVLSGYALSLRRARARGLDAHTVERLFYWALLFGFVGAHLYSVLLSYPDQVARDPSLLLRVWDKLSSFGGFLGGVIGIWAFFRWRRPEWEPARRWAHLDAVAFSLPFAWAWGRLGCTFAHDHPGGITGFFLGRSLETPAAQAYIGRIYEEAGRAAQLPPPAELPGLAFHDLGWYEFLYLSLVVVPAFLILDREERPPGFWLAAFFLLYAPVRFALDFLRVGDAEYLGLIPPQFLALAATVAGAAYMLRYRPAAVVSEAPRVPLSERSVQKRAKSGGRGPRRGNGGARSRDRRAQRAERR